MSAITNPRAFKKKKKALDRKMNKKEKSKGDIY